MTEEKPVKAQNETKTKTSFNIKQTLKTIFAWVFSPYLGSLIAFICVCIFNNKARQLIFENGGELLLLTFTVLPVLAAYIGLLPLFVGFRIIKLFKWWYYALIGLVIGTLAAPILKESAWYGYVLMVSTSMIFWFIGVRGNPAYQSAPVTKPILYIVLLYFFCYYFNFVYVAVTYDTEHIDWPVKE